MKITMQGLLVCVLALFGTRPDGWSQEVATLTSSATRPSMQLYTVSLHVIEMDLVAAKKCGFGIASSEQVTRTSMSAKDSLRFKSILKAYEEADVAKTLFNSYTTGVSHEKLEDTLDSIAAQEGASDDGHYTLKTMPKVDGEVATTSFKLELFNRKSEPRKTKIGFSFESKLGESLVMKYGASNNSQSSKVMWVVLCVDRYDRSN